MTPTSHDMAAPTRAGEPDRRRWVAGTLAAATTGIVVALAVVRVGVRQTAASRAYVDQAEYAVWGGLVLVAVPAMAILALLSTWWAVEIRALPPDDDRPRWQVVLGWLAAIGAGIALAYAQGIAMAVDYPRSYPDDQSIRAVTLAVIVAVAVAVPAIALWGLSRAAAAIEPTSTSATTSDPTSNDEATSNDPIERFSLLWSRQRAFLSVLGLVLGLVMLVTSAKYHANNSFTPPGDSPLTEVPTTFLLVSGLFYGAILLALYLPPYYATRQAGEKLAAALCAPSTDPSPTARLALIDERDRYRAAMGLDESPWQHLQRSAVLLAPLLTALLTTLLPS